MITARKETKNADSQKTITINSAMIDKRLDELTLDEFHRLFSSAFNKYSNTNSSWDDLWFVAHHAKASDIVENGLKSSNWKQDLYDFLELDVDSYVKSYNKCRSLKLEVILELFKIDGDRVAVSQDTEKTFILFIKAELFKKIENAKAKIEDQRLAARVPLPTPKISPSETLVSPAVLEHKTPAKLPEEAEISEKLNAITEKNFPAIFFNSFNSFPLTRWSELSFPWRTARQNRLKDMRYMTWKIDLFDFLKEKTPQNQQSFKFHVLAAFLKINKENYDDQQAQLLIENTMKILRGMISAEYTQEKARAVSFRY